MGKSAGKNRNNAALGPAGSEMGERIRSFDWNQTPLGDLSTWEQSLKTSVSLMLNSRYPMFVWWGPELTNLYNDAYVPILGKRHPDALGKPAPEVWKEIWPILGPQAELVVEKGQATWNDELLLVMERFGFTEETYFTFSYSPIVDDRGQVNGVFCACTEETAKVVGRRRLKLLRDLGERTLEETRSLEQAVRAAAETLSSDPFDIPFALVYLVDGQRAVLAERVSVDEDAGAAPAAVDVGSGSDLWDFAGAAEAGRQTTKLSEARFGKLSAGAWEDDSADQAVVLPLYGTSDAPAGFLVCGLSPRLSFDDDYAGFIDLIAGQISTAIGNAISFQEEKARAEALAELDRAKTEFFSNVSHEFRTPLTLTLGNIEEIVQSEDLPERQREQLDSAHRNSLRLLKLVNTLLDFSRIEAGRAQKNFEPVDLASLTKDLAGSFRSAVESAGLNLNVEALDHSLVMADREMWEKIVLNLISNAYKFTFEGQIDVSLKESGDFVVLEVQDTGVGIPEDQLEKVFDRFHRVRSTLGRTHEGTGIGLSLVRELVHLHDGEISVRSELGNGTVFTVKIPKATHVAHVAAVTRRQNGDDSKLGGHSPSGPLTDAFLSEMAGRSSEQPTVSNDGNNGDVLLVDDNADMRSYVGRLLSDAGYRVRLAGDGVEALELAATEVPDVILSDVMMPRLNGFELLKAIRDKERLRDVPFIMLSARAGEESKVEGLDAGADDYLIKPFSANELLSRVRSQLALRNQRAEAERQIRESAERYRAFIENSSEGIWRIELEEPIDTSLPAEEQVRLAYERGYLAECNDAMARQYGFDSAEQIVGLRLADLLIADDPNNTAFLEAFVASGYRLTDAESHERDADGKDRYFLNNFIGIIEDGLLLRAWGSQRDITASRTADISRARLAAIVESSEDAIIGLDLKGNVTTWNAAAERMYGYTEQEMIGKDIRSLIPQDRGGEEDALLAKVTSGQPVEHLETVRLARSGHPLDVAVTISPIRDPSGHVVGVSKTARDISDRKNSERVLNENRLMLAMAMQSGRMGVWERDFATGVVRWSEELESIFGLAPGEFRGDEQHYYELIHEDDRDAAWHEVEQAIIEHRPYTIEFRFYHANGSVRWMEGRGEAVYSSAGEPVRLYGVGIDVTERKLTDERIRTSEERFRLALSSGAVTVYEQDIDLRYHWLHPLERYAPGTIGKTDEEIVPGEHGKRLTELKRQVIATGESIREEISATLAGEQFWYDLIIEPRFDASGTIVGVGGAALDITARRKAEEQLKREALLLEAALEPVIVWELDGTIMDWNRGAERLYGYSAAEAIGRVTHELLQTRLPTDFEDVRSSLTEKGNWVGEIRHTSKNGDEIVVESRHQLVEFDGKFLVLETNRDISERKRVAEELRRSEARLQAMFDATTVGFAVLDTSLRFLQINDAFCKITGYSRDELLEMDSTTLTYPDDIATMDAGFESLIAGEIPHFTFEKRYIRKDGSLVWVQSSISLTRDPFDRPLHLIAISQDITDRKAAEEQVLLISRMPAENPHPVLRLSPDGEIIYANDAAAPMLEFWKRSGQTLPADLLDRVKTAFRTGNKKEIEVVYEGRTVGCTIAPVVEAGYVNIYGTDITSRKMAVEALRESEQRFSRFMQQLPGLAWIKDAEGRYVYANDAAERSFGISKADLYGKVDEEVFPPDSAKQFREHDRRAMESGTGLQVLESMVESDGVLHHSIVSKFPISGPDGKPALIGGMAIDVTEQKQAEEALRRRMEFDEAVMTNMGEGLYTVDAHGLVTSMNPAAEKLFGWTFDEIRGRKMHDLTHYKHRDGSPFPAEECAGLKILERGEALVNHEDVFIRKDGSFFDVLFSSAPIRENGVTTGLVVVFQDISERKQAREALERYRHVSEYASDSIWLLKEDGEIVEVNQAALNAYGYTREEMIGMNVRDLRDPSTLISIDSELREANEGSTFFETLHLRKDGTSFPVEVNASSAEFGGERLIMSILRDITERKREEKNHEFLFHLSDLVRTADEPAAIFDEAARRLGRHLGLSRCFISAIDLENETSTLMTEFRKGDVPPLEPTVKFSEYSKTNLKAAQSGRTIVVIDAEHDRRTAEKFSEGYTRDRIGSYVAAPLMRDGRWAAIFFASYEQPHEWSEWEVALIETVAERVWLAAEKLRSEAALRESERRAVEQYQSLLERIVPLAETLGAARELLTIYRALHEFICASMDCSGFFVSFFDANESLRVPAYIWGEGEEIDVSSLPPMRLDPSTGGPNSQAVFSKQTVITNAYWDHQKNKAHLVLRDNGIDPMSSIVVPMVVQDRVIGTLEVQAHQDGAFEREQAVALEMAANLAAVAIENVRLIEVEARARSEAESANRMKDEFLSVLSHELRTPLNAMLGWVRILRSGNVDQERLEKALEIIERNTRQQSSLIEDLLDVSRIISGKMRIEHELIDLVQCLEQAAEVARPLAVAKGVEFEVDTASEPLYLKGDAVRLQQVITNLLQNAVKFTPPAGKVSLAFGIEGHEAVVTVSDTGVGIDPEFLPHIFDRFSQADASTRRTNTGLGLGLTIVHTIVQLHGGMTTAESGGDGRGAKFTVRLPLADELYKTEASVPPVVTNGSSNSLSGVRILVVDDDADGLAPLRIMLERESAMVATAASAKEALSRLRSADFDILISDIGMPSMDGFELIKRLRSNKRQRNHAIKAIAYTAYASEEDRNRVLSAGYHVHLAKPLDFDELLTIVRNFGSGVGSGSGQN